MMRKFFCGDRYVDELVERDRDTNGDGSLDERLYALQDANFDVTAIADASTGTIVERYSYTPYGTRTIMDGSWGSRTSSSYDWTIGHQGLAQDDESGLIGDRHRTTSDGGGVCTLRTGKLWDALIPHETPQIPALHRWHRRFARRGATVERLDVRTSSACFPQSIGYFSRSTISPKE
jgi:hypothetical protein